MHYDNGCGASEESSVTPTETEKVRADPPVRTHGQR
jgi:hypothetical protein